MSKTTKKRSTPQAESSPTKVAQAPRWRRWASRFVYLMLVLAAVALVVAVMVVRHYEKDLPSTTELRSYKPVQVTRVLARDETVIGELFIERRTVIHIQDIPNTMKLAVLAAEDADFYKHEGLDYIGMVRALIVNLRAKRAKQGASTITQQVVKNFLLSPEKTFRRKMRELLLARRIEQELTKDQILELYLNHIYFGHGRYGIEEASRYYFGKSVRDVSLQEAALLASLPKAPSRYSPRVNLERARRRRDLILGQIAKKGFVPADVVAKAEAKPIVLAAAEESFSELAPEVVDEVQRTLRKVAGPRAKRGGFSVRTTLDPKLQALGRKSLRQSLDAYLVRHKLTPPLKKRKHQPKLSTDAPQIKVHRTYVAEVTGFDGNKKGRLKLKVGGVDGFVNLKQESRYNPKKLSPSKFAEVGRRLHVSPIAERNVDDQGVPHEFRLELGPQGALVAVDVKTREIRALVGGYDGRRGALDRATFAKRQPGSTFKPFVYSYGLHTRQLTAATVMVPSVDNKRPALLLRDALAASVNAAAQRAYNDLGGEGIVAWAYALGLESTLKPTPSLALGAYEVTPRELAGAYGTIAGGGRFEPTSLITEVHNADHVAVGLPARPPGRQVMDPAESYLTVHLLKSVVRYGTGRKARSIPVPLAGKTGTSNDARDSWFAGFSPEIVCIIWTGFDDNRPLGTRESGASIALPAWVTFMKGAHEGRKVADFERPKGLVEQRIDPATGLLPYPDQEKTRSELFLIGTQPSDVAPIPAEDEDPKDEGDKPADPDKPAPVPPPPPARPSADSGDSPPPF